MGLGIPEEEPAEDADAIGHVENAAIVGISGVPAGEFRVPEEERVQHVHGIVDPNLAVSVRIASSERLLRFL